MDGAAWHSGMESQDRARALTDLARPIMDLCPGSVRVARRYSPRSLSVPTVAKIDDDGRGQEGLM